MLPGGCEVQAEQPSGPPAYPVRFKPLLERASASEREKRPWRQDSNRRFLGDIEKVLVTSHQDLCPGRNGVCQDPLIIGISQWDRGRFSPSGKDIATVEDRLHRRECSLARLELRREHAKDFLRDNLGEDELVLRQNQLQEVRAEASSDEGCDKDVGIQADSRHETSLKTSSSV